MNKKNKVKKERLRDRLKEQIKTHKRAFVLYMFLRLLVLITLILQLIHGNYENAFLCILTLILFLIPSFFEEKFKLDLPEAFEIIILLFIFAAEILGEIQNFYNVFANWDLILHTINGFLCAAVGFSLIDILNRYDKFHLNLSPIFVAIVGFCFSMTIGVLWEFFEYGADIIMHTDMQKDKMVDSIYSVSLNEDSKNIVESIENIDKVYIISEDKTYLLDGYLDIGLNDTMGDLMVNFIGATVYSVIGFIYVKKRDKGSIAEKFIVKMKE